jgi:hypothetical protein
VGKIIADFITQVYVMENKMRNYMRVIREEIETRIGDLCVDEAELDEKLDKPEKNVASMVKQKNYGRQCKALGENSRPN